MLAAVLAAVLSLCGCEMPESNATALSAAEMTAHFIDVGQADSIFVELPEGETMLVDAGNNKDGGTVVGYLHSLGVEKIDYLVGTHPHADHIGGMDDVIDEFEIGDFYMPRATTNTKTFEEVLDAAERKGLKIKTAKAGKSLFETENAACEILSPVEDKYSNLNEYSAVLMLTCGNVRFLLTGDMEAKNETEIAGDVHADVLKVAHHGSDTSSTDKFLKRVSPEYAVISVGENNKYSHPSDAVVDRLEADGAKILRTDRDGTVIIATDGENITYKTEKGDKN